MRTVRLLPVGLALLAGVLGCSRTINYTAGVCDCNPPDVASLLVPPPRPHPGAFVGAPVAPAVVKPTAAKPGAAAKTPAPSGEQFPENVPPLDPLPVVPTPPDNLPK